MSVLSEILSLLEKRPTSRNWYDYQKWLIGFEKDVEKLLSPYEKRWALVMAHLQNRPRYEPISNLKASTSERTYNAINTMMKMEEWFEELDKRIGQPENYVCVPLEDYGKQTSGELKHVIRGRIEILKTKDKVPKRAIRELEWVEKLLSKFVVFERKKLEEMKTELENDTTECLKRFQEPNDKYTRQIIRNNTVLTFIEELLQPPTSEELHDNPNCDCEECQTARMLKPSTTSADKETEK